MQATLKLNIVNKETANLLKRTLKNGDNHFERACVKIGLLIKDSLLNNAYALVTLYQMHDDILNLSGFFDDEIDKFEGQLEKKKSINFKKIEFVARYEHALPFSNALTSTLYELIQGFDRLISTVSLLHINGLIDSKIAFYQIKNPYQKSLNALLSKIIQTSSARHYDINLLTIINEEDVFDESVINLHTLKAALNAPYAPGFSPQKAHQLRYKLSQLTKKMENDLPEIAKEAQL